MAQGGLGQESRSPGSDGIVQHFPFGAEFAVWVLWSQGRKASQRSGQPRPSIHSVVRLRFLGSCSVLVPLLSTVRVSEVAQRWFRISASHRNMTIVA